MNSNHYHFGKPEPIRGHNCADCAPAPPPPPRTAKPDPAECVRLCEAISAFWGDELQCEAPIHPGAYITDQDIPIRDLVRAALGWRKP